jgi:hypothetical protein
MTVGFTPEEQSQFAAHGVSVDEVERQISLFEHPPGFMRLERACRVGDGIHQLTSRELAAAESECDRARQQGRLMKFVPASGAATRMFQALLAARSEHRGLRRAHLASLAERGDATAAEVLAFMEGWPRFPFCDEIGARRAATGRDAVGLACAGDFTELVDVLLGDDGLSYAALPKGLLSFHAYAEGVRTAFEEHLVDAARWMSDGRTCRLHFTVSPEHQALFAALAERACARYQSELGIRFEVTFSTQKHSTDTVAVDLDNPRLSHRGRGRPVSSRWARGADRESRRLERRHHLHREHRQRRARSPEGCCHAVEARALRPSGSAATSGVRVPRTAAARRRVTSARCRRSGVRAYPSRHCVSLGAGRRRRAHPACVSDRQAQSAVARLRHGSQRRRAGRGAVLAEDDGTATPQIVESAQVDDATMQRSIFRTATHFNPVELACAVRDWRAPVPVDRFVDANAVFIARNRRMAPAQHWNAPACGTAPWRTGRRCSSRYRARCSIR